MYQSWPLGATTTATTTAGYVQPTTTGQDVTSQWPAGYNQYALTPEMQQQWAAWASQAQYAYGSAMQMPGQIPGTSYTGVYADPQAENKLQATEDKSKNSSDEPDPEIEFEKQFKDWEKQFESWKKENANHPDKEAFAQYEKQWQDWRAQLLEKKEQMLKAKAEKAAAAGTAAASTTATTAAAAAANAMTAANMYYQQSQYMQQYMQQYMYSQQYPYAAQSQTSMAPTNTVGQHAGGPTQTNPNENNTAEAYNYEQTGGQEGYAMGGGAYPPDDAYNNYEEYGNNSNAYPAGMDFQRDASFGRGRGRDGRGGRRGRGGRWDTNDGPNRNASVPLLADPLPSFPDDLRCPPGFSEDSRGPPEFSEDPRGPPNFHDDPRGQQGFPNDHRGSRDFSDDPRGPPNFPDGPRGPPNFRDGPRGYRDGLRDFPERRRGPRDYPPGPGQFHDEMDGPPPYEFPTEDFEEIYPPNDRPFPNELARDRRNFPEPPYRDGHDRPFRDGHPREYNDRFGPPPRDCYPGDRRDMYMMDRDFDRYGPPTFDDEFGPPPGRFPPGRGHFQGRGGRFPPSRGEFDRFGPFPHEGPLDDFPPDDRFHPYDRRGRPSRGRGGRFPPDERPFGPEPGPLKFETVDYTHKPASAVMGEEFNQPPEYENEFQDDVMKYRDNFSTGLSMAPHETVVFSQVKVESIDYEHHLKSIGSDAAASKELDGSNMSTVNRPEFAKHEKRNKSAVKDKTSDQYEDRVPENDQQRSREKDFHRNRNWESDRDYRNQMNTRGWNKNYDRNTRENEMFDEKDGQHWDDRGRDSRREWHNNKEPYAKWDNGSSPQDIDNFKASGLESKDDSRNSFKNDVFEGEPAKAALIDDLLLPPLRLSRPKQLVIILRGLPGSGKTYVAKLIKDKEVENGGSAPRILSLDDYFMTEVEVTDVDPDTNKPVKRKEFKFEHESEMEESYRSSLFKSFKKTIDDRFFPFIIVDAVHDKSSHYDQFWSYAKQRGFQVYIAEMDCQDTLICHKRNVHNRSLEEITKILRTWQPKPRHFMKLDIRSLLQDVAITDVEMEVESDEKTKVPEEGEKSEEQESSESKNDDNEAEDTNSLLSHVPSKWESFEATDEKLDQLDGLRASKKKHSSMEDYLQLPDDYDNRTCEPGKKRVRWADLEERKEQDRIRAIGFVVGQTDWNKMTDPTHADKALTKTKYF